MRKGILIAGILLACGLIVSIISGQAGTRVTVVAAGGWQNSGVYLDSGELYTVRARGSWVSGQGHAWYGPQGWSHGTITNDALVGWISGSAPARLGYDSYRKDIVQNIILIDEGGTFKAYNRGYLYLAMGEWSGCRECQGQVEVVISKR